MRIWSKYVGLIALTLAILGGVFVQVAQAQRSEFQPPVMVVNTSFLNVRTGPSPAYPILTTVTGGTQLPVLGIARDRVWYQVSTLAGIGWINAEFAIGRGDFRNVPTVEAPALPVFNPDDFFDPNLLGSGGGSEQAVAPVGSSSGRAWGVSVFTSHTARLSPGVNAASPGQAVQDTSRIYPLLSGAGADGIFWYQTTLPGLGTVWLEGGKARVRPYACQLSAVVIRGQVFPSVGPDGSGTIPLDVGFNDGDELYLLDARDGFYRVEGIDGRTAWIRQEQAAVRSNVTSAFCSQGGIDSGIVSGPVPGTSADRPPGSTQVLRSPARVVINTGNLNIRSGPGSQFSVVATVPGGTILDITGFAPDGVWYRVVGNFGTGWLNSEFTILRGDGRSIPIIRDAFGSLSQPSANVTNAVTLFAAPNAGAGVIGALSGTASFDIVARTADNVWVQLSSPIGFGWVQTALVGITGDLTAAPIVGG